MKYTVNYKGRSYAFGDLKTLLAKASPLRSADELAGIAAAKRTAELIPLCHNLPLDHVEVALRLRSNVVEIRVEASAFARTGVEMEAMTAASVAALTVYDMLKAIDKGMRIGPVLLLEKSGGKSGTWKVAKSGR